MLWKKCRAPYRQANKLPFEVERTISGIKKGAPLVGFAAPWALFGLSKLAVWWLPPRRAGRKADSRLFVI